MAKKNGSPVLGFIFTLIGLIGLGTSGWLTYNTLDFMDNSVSTIGTVVHVETNYDDDGVTYRPTFRYLDENSNKLRAQTSWSSSEYDFDVGERMEILYDRRDPERMRLNSWFSIWGLGLIPGAVGAVFFIVGRLVRRTQRKVARRIENVEREIRTTTKYASQQSRESAEEHAREIISNPTVRRRR